MKVCSKCLVEKDFSCFNKWKSEYWLYPYCKKCVSILSKIYRENNKSKIKNYYKNNKDKIKEYQEENKDSIKKRMAKYYKDNKEEILNRTNKYYHNNKDTITLKRKIYVENNKEEIYKRIKKYRQSEKWKIMIQSSWNKRRALKITTATEKITADMLSNILKKQNSCCVLCWVFLDFNIKRFVHLDHIYPLSKWGTHTLDNLQYLCSNCNLKKWAKIN